MWARRRIYSIGAAVAAVAAVNVFGVAAAGASSSRVFVVGPNQSIQHAVNQAVPGDTVLLRPGVYHQSVQIRTDGITLHGSGDAPGGTRIVPPSTAGNTLCTAVFGPTGVCVLAKQVNPKNGNVIQPVYNDTVRNLAVSGFAGNGVFGYGTYGLTVTGVSATNDGAYGISRFESTKTLFADDVVVGNDEAGFYVGDSPDAATVVRNNITIGNQFGIFVRHARGVQVLNNTAIGNCQGILVLDDGQVGGAGNAVIRGNTVSRNNQLCPANDDTPVTTQGGGILLLGATQTLVAGNAVSVNKGAQFNSGGIVVLSAQVVSGGSDPEFDTVARNTAFGDQPADVIWDGTGTGNTFVGNHCGTSMPTGLCK